MDILEQLLQVFKVKIQSNLLENIKSHLIYNCSFMYIYLPLQYRFPFFVLLIFLKGSFLKWMIKITKRRDH